MHQALLAYIQQEHLFNVKDKILLAVSGGIDSVVMCNLFHTAGLQFAIAHCNFQLRADESDTDELFVQEIAARYKVSFHHIRFDTKGYAKKNKLSIQVAARDLRYEWFEKIRIQHHYAYIATAHHQGDVIETFFINLIRGTGISGLRSIVPKHEKIIRPLLFTTKKAIITYAEKKKLDYREDSSNASDNYLRNKIRHHLIPVLNEFSPVAESAVMNSIEKLREAEFIYKKAIEEARSKICREKNNSILLSITELKKLNPVTTYLYELLKPYNFNAVTVSAIVKLLEGESGKQFFGSTHRLIKDRGYLIVEPLSASDHSAQAFAVQENQPTLELPVFHLHFHTFINSNEHTIPADPKVAAVDLDKLEFPLEVRKWRAGDTFYPLGMKGKKKLSDFFIDKKLSLIEKENTWLLCSNDRIVWIIGMRLDERFKISNTTRKVFVATRI